MLGGERRGSGDKGEGVCWGAVEARVKEEKEASKKTAEAWKNHPSGPAGAGFTF